MKDDPQLLQLMLTDSDAQSDLYRAGPYWHARGVRAAQLIERYGIKDFRGSSVIEGFGDVFVPTADPEETRRALAAQLRASPRVHELLDQYKMPPSMSGGCADYVEIGGRKVSMLYLSLLHEHDVVAQTVDFNSVTTFFEIGGGFGANVHMLLANYPNIRRVVYLDIPPNLYSGTQYLRQFYPVRDYRDTRGGPKFGKGREILAIAPWQIEQLDIDIDLFWNAHSMVEMPQPVAANYAAHVAGAKRIVLLSYGGFNLGSTWHPDLLPGLFPEREFARTVFPPLFGDQERYLFVG